VSKLVGSLKINMNSQSIESFCQTCELLKALAEISSKQCNALRFEQLSSICSNPGPNVIILDIIFEERPD
jgi:hypothetical protein